MHLQRNIIIVLLICITQVYSGNKTLCLTSYYESSLANRYESSFYSGVLSKFGVYSINPILAYVHGSNRQTLTIYANNRFHFPLKDIEQHVNVLFGFIHNDYSVSTGSGKYNDFAFGIYYGAIFNLSNRISFLTEIGMRDLERELDDRLIVIGDFSMGFVFQIL